jgi:hypothetical protein
LSSHCCLTRSVAENGELIHEIPWYHHLDEEEHKGYKNEKFDQAC